MGVVVRNLYIFGDSFGEEVPIGFPPEHTLHQRVMALVSYHDIIRDSGLFNKVNSFAEGGSNLWKQFVLFKEKIQEIHPDDIVVWFETHPGRLTSKCGVNLPNLNSAERHLRNHLLNSKISGADFQHRTNIHEAAINYFKFLQRDDYDEFAHSAIKDTINKLRPNIYWIPCFNTKHNGLRIDQILANAYSIENHEFSKYLDLPHYIDLRRNHMIEENHAIFARNFIEYIQNGTEICFDKFVTPKQEDCSIYFERIK
jgi:hypothetical protein